MIQYKFNIKSVDIYYLSKKQIEDIDKQLNLIEAHYGKMDVTFLEENRLHYGYNTVIKNGSECYHPCVSAWNYIKENDDNCIIELNVDWENKDMASEYAKSIIKYIKCKILNNEIERL